jgi:hypothetical protein
MTRLCPSCAGAWLYGLTFDHAVVGCPIRDADDATVAADHDLLTGSRGYWRPARPHEQTLATALGWAPPTARFGEPMTYQSPTVWTNVQAVTGSVTTRRLRIGDNGTIFDPDAPEPTP